jgi:hypothetical protein
MSFDVTFSERDGLRMLCIDDTSRGLSMSLGIEIGTLESFFSFEKQALGRARQTNALASADNASWAFDADLGFEAAHVHVSERGGVDGNEGHRTLCVRAQERSHLMDSVLRFIIPKVLVKQARIGSRGIAHERRNRYHQFPADIVELHLVSGAILRFYPEKMDLPTGFAPLVYLRDEPDDWILHFRVLALAPDALMLKGCSRWYNRPFPPVLQRAAFSAFPRLGQRLLFVRERVSQRIPIQVNGAATVEAGETLSLAVRWVMQDA